MKKTKIVTFLFGALFCVFGLTLAACGNDDGESSSIFVSQDTGDEVAEHVHVWGDPAWTWTKDGDTYKASATFTCTLDSTHTKVVEAEVEQAGTVKKANDCTHEGTISYTATVSLDGNTYTNSKEYSIAPNGHHVDNAWDNDETHHWHNCNDCSDKVDKEEHVIGIREEIKPSTCQERGWKKEIQYCTICQRELSTSTVTYGYGPHKYVKDNDLSYEPTCAVPGQLVQRCSDCGNVIVTPIAATGIHTYLPEDQERTCEHSRECQVCHAVQEALDHDYELQAHTDADCTHAGNDHYECKNCDSSFDVPIPATGHHYHALDDGDWTTDYERIGTTCEYNVIMRADAECNDCDHVEHLAVNKGTTFRHNYVATVVSNPTCTHTGITKYICSDCGAVKKNEYDEDVVTVIPVNEGNHVWGAPDANGVSHCTEDGCTATKTTLEAASEGTLNVTDGALNTEQKIVDLDLKNVSLQLNEATKNTLNEKSNVSVSATELTKNTLPDGVVAPDNLEADAKIFNFEITSGGDPVESFGTDGAITVKIPYTLAEGEDPEAIVIWHLNGDKTFTPYDAQFISKDPSDPNCKVGYVTFEATHFSVYTVAQLTAQERCAAFGHRYGEDIVIAPTCLQAGYTYHVCSVCGDKVVFDQTQPTGHHFEHNPSDSSAATCTQDGYYDEVCTYCGVHRGEIVSATGHEYEFVSRVEPTCSLPGSATYKCAHCDDVKVVGIPAKGHTYEIQDITPATCTEEGLRAYKCTECGQEDPTKGHIVVPALGHDYHESSDTEEQTTYECSRCHHEHVVQKVSAAFNKEVATTNNFYINAAKSIVGNDITVKLDNSHFYLTMPDDKVLKLSGDDAELHIGLDAKNKLVAYGNATFGYENNMGSTPNETSGKAAFYLENGKIYVKLYNDNTSTNTYYYYDLAYVTMGGGENPMTLGKVLDMVPDIVDYIDKDVAPYIDKLLNANKEEITDFGYHLFETFLSVKSTPDGYVFSIDINKLCNVVSMLTDGTTTLKEFLDTIIGEGNTKKLLDNVRDLTQMTLEEALTKIKTDTGIDYKELIALIDKGVARFSEYDSLRDLIYDMTRGSFDLNEYLSDAYLKGHSVVSIVKENDRFAQMFGDGTIATFIDQQVRDMLEMTFVDLLNNMMGGGMGTTIADMIDHYVDLVRTNASGLKFYAVTDVNGNVQNLGIDAELAEVDLFDAELHVSIEFGEYYSLFNYQDIVNFVDRNLNHIYNENFSSSQKVEDYFSQSQSIAFFKKDANNNIEEVKTYKFGNMAYGGYNQINSEVDLVRYAGRTYYNELLGLYEQNKDKYNIIVIDQTSVEEETITGFVPATLTMTEGCSDDFEVKYGLPSSRKNAWGGYDSVTYVAVDKNTGEYVDIKFLQTNPYSYRGTFVGSLATNATSGEFKEDVREHNWTLVSTDPSTITCGATVTEIYQCGDCGKTKVERYVAGHVDAHITGRHFLHQTSEEEHHSCYEGVVTEYHCDACGKDYNETTYRHLYNYKETFQVKFGKKKYTAHIVDCFCGEHVDRLVFDGLDEYNTFYHHDDVTQDGYEYHMYRNYQTDELIYAGIYYKQLNNECMAERYLRFYDNKGEVLESYSLGKVTRHTDTELLYSTLNHDPLTDAYTCTSHCNKCHRDEIITLNPNEWGKNFVIKGKELGFTDTENRNRSVIHIYGRIRELAEGVAENVYLWNIPNYENIYNNESYNETTHTYTYEYREEYNPDNGTYGPGQYKFMYTRQMEQELRDGTSCKYYEGSIIKLYKSKDGAAALTIFEKSGEARYDHNYNLVSSDIHHFTVNGVDIDVDYREVECTSCGKEDTLVHYTVHSPEYTGAKEVVDGDWIIRYPDHYYPEIEFGYNDSSSNDSRLYGSYERYNDTTGERVYNHFSIEADSYENHYNDEVEEGIRLSLRTEKQVHIGYNNETYIKEESGSSRYAYETQAPYYDERVTTYHYAFESDFAEKCLELAGIEYNGLTHGCLKFRDTVWTDAHQEKPQTQIEFNYDSHDKYGGNSGQATHFGPITADIPGQEPSCSQHGSGHCSVCGQVAEMEPTGHQDKAEPYNQCDNCGITLNGYSIYGEGLVLEDLSNEDTITIGYAYKYYNGFDDRSLSELNYNVNVYFFDGLEHYEEVDFVWLSGVQGSDQYDGINHKYVIDKADIQAALANANINEDSYIEVEFAGYHDANEGPHYGSTVRYTATELGLYTPAP